MAGRFPDRLSVASQVLLSLRVEHDPNAEEVGVKVLCEPHEVGYICQVAGTLESATVPEFRQSVADLAPANGFIFDLSGLTFVDSAGLGALLGAVRRAREAGGDAVFCNARTSVDRVLQMTFLPRVVYVAASLEDAIDYFEAPMAV